MTLPDAVRKLLVLVLISAWCGGPGLAAAEGDGAQPKPKTNGGTAELSRAEMERMVDAAFRKFPDNPNAATREFERLVKEAYAQRFPDVKPPPVTSSTSEVTVTQVSDGQWKDPHDVKLVDTTNPAKPDAKIEAMQVPKPVWAAQSGKDRYGVWAELHVLGLVQTMRYIPPGTFVMGTDLRHTKHEVTITQPFWMADSVVTQEFWEKVTGRNPSHFKGNRNLPVESVAWNDIGPFLTKLNSLVKGLRAQLPSEAQWEYACRAGTTGDYAGVLKDMGWYKDNSGGQPHLVRMKLPNAWGLYDMHGNVMQWCQDIFAPYGEGPRTDPLVLVPPAGFEKDAESLAMHVARGGSWFDSAQDAMSGIRKGCRPSEGAWMDATRSIGVRLCVPGDKVGSGKSAPGDF